MYQTFINHDNLRGKEDAQKLLTELYSRYNTLCVVEKGVGYHPTMETPLKGTNFFAGLISKWEGDDFGDYFARVDMAFFLTSHPEPEVSIALRSDYEDLGKKVESEIIEILDRG